MAKRSVEQARAVGKPLDDAPPATFFHGNNLEALRTLRERGTKVHLVYLDPPFFTQRVHHRTHRKRNARTGRMQRHETPAFDDRWDDLDSYISSLRERLEVVRDLLTPDGCVVVHVDPTTSHYVKVMCDDVFGFDAFASEIVWRYRRWPAKTPNFQRMHDVLLRYVRDPAEPPRFNQLYEPLAASTKATWGTAKQRAEVGRDGRRIRSTKTAEASPGAPLADVWEIGVIAPVARERTGYPTQKPEKLLARLIEACSHPGDTVLDPYAGSGTTLAAAMKLGRLAIGIDASDEALEVTRTRLEDLGARLEVEVTSSEA